MAIRKGNFPLKKSKPKKSRKSVKGLEKDLKNILYPVIKRRDVDEPCISCEKYPNEGTDTQAGHFTAFELCNQLMRWYSKNINKQCSGCNGFKHGNGTEYRKGMLYKYGVEEVDYIETYYKTPLPISFNYRDWLVTTIEKLKGQTDEFILNYMEFETRSMLSSLSNS